MSKPEVTTAAAVAQAAKIGGFTFETVKELPDARAGGQTKYDWASFPAPTKAEDGSDQYARTFISGVNAKTIYTSIKAFQAKVEAKGQPAPQFTVRREKNDKDEVTGVWVYRTA